MTGAQPERLIDGFVRKYTYQLDWLLQDFVFSRCWVVFRAWSWPEPVYDQELDVLHSSKSFSGGGLTSLVVVAAPETVFNRMDTLAGPQQGIPRL